jgi:hypothetical protein
MTNTHAELGAKLLPSGEDGGIQCEGKASSGQRHTSGDSDVET